jgi:hypothetical protein
MIKDREQKARRSIGPARRRRGGAGRVVSVSYAFTSHSLWGALWNRPPGSLKARRPIFSICPRLNRKLGFRASPLGVGAFLFPDAGFPLPGGRFPFALFLVAN